jgi:hypothetical protein
VSDRSAERALARRARDIDVDPLPVAGAGRKLVDAVLIDRDPVGGAELPMNCGVVAML